MLSDDPLWYKDAVFYEIHVKAFADGNGDGIGDFQGLIGKLDYLQWLGVDCLWLITLKPPPLQTAYWVAPGPWTGATLTARALTDGARRILALHLAAESEE